MQFTLTTPINQDPVVISAFEILQFIDSPDGKTVAANISLEGVGVVGFNIWEGDAYDAIGQWTTDQAVKRTEEMIIEKYSN